MTDDLGLGLEPGEPHYRAFVGPPADYDLICAMTFGLLTSLGLRQHHKVLDIGCGSLRIARLLVPYLNQGGYTGIEPHQWLMDEGIAKEMGADQIALKKPNLICADNAAVIAESEQFDFAFAQSIFSHTGTDLLDGWLRETSRVLKPTGALAATFLIDSVDAPEQGWIYPGCVRFTPRTMAYFASKHGLEFHILGWRHPRQTWGLFSKPGFDRSWFLSRDLCWNTYVDFGPKPA